MELTSEQKRLADIAFTRERPNRKGTAMDCTYAACAAVLEGMVPLAELGRIRTAAQTLVDAMETCHICTGTLLVEDGPMHCEDCSFDCESHDGEECVTIYSLHLVLKSALAHKEPAARVGCDNSSGLPQINAPQCAMQAEASAGEEDALVKRMLRAFDCEKDQDYSASPSDRISCMGAALREAEKSIDAEWEQATSFDTIRKFLSGIRCIDLRDDAYLNAATHDFIGSIRTFLASRRQRGTPEQKVTVKSKKKIIDEMCSAYAKSANMEFDNTDWEGMSAAHKVVLAALAVPEGSKDDE